MVASVPVVSSTEVPTLDALIEALDLEVRDAIADVDRTLIRLSLQQSPWDRMRSASRMAQALARMADAAASQRR
jgi:hypothetical protein